MTEFTMFRADDWNRCLNWFIEPDEPHSRAVVLMLRGGHTVLFRDMMGATAFNPVRVEGFAAPGTDRIFVSPGDIVAYTLLEHYEPEDEGMAPEAAKAWTDALMYLRACADESNDERVKDAAARLDRAEAGS